MDDREPARVPERRERPERRVHAEVAVEVDRLVADADRRDPDLVLDRFVRTLIPQGVRPETRAVLERYVTDPQITRLTADDRGPANTDAAKLAALVLGSPDFQRR